MSLDALLYASATSNVRRGRDGAWKFPGYLRDDDKKCESRDAGRFALLDTGWIQRVRSFVTLGSPIDKYLTIWWLNYGYLLKCSGRLEAGPTADRSFQLLRRIGPGRAQARRGPRHAGLQGSF